MNAICHHYAVVSLSIMAGVIGLSNLGAVNAGTSGDACALLTAPFIEPRAMAMGLSVKKGDVCFQVRARSNPVWFKSGKTPESEQKDRDVDRALALEILKKL